jgi:uncharacterized membrane protein YeiH
MKSIKRTSFIMLSGTSLVMLGTLLDFLLQHYPMMWAKYVITMLILYPVIMISGWMIRQTLKNFQKK